VTDNPGGAAGRAVPEIEGIFDLVPIGRGGFGTVFRGHQADINRTVAIKVLNGPPHDAEAARRFRREVTAMGAISHHPNVVPVYAIGVAGDGRPYLVMPYLPGGTLADRLGMPWQQMVDLGSKMSGALQAAHDVGVLHRDVKPANILWSAWNEPQLADFGIARLHDTTRTAPGMVVASLTWAAPEVLEGKPASPASDLYSLAACLHAAITGRSPYAPGPDEPLATTVARIASQPAADLTAYGVPHDLNEVIAAAMAKDPARRPASARSFGDALVGAAAAQPAMDRVPAPVPTIEPVVVEPVAVVEPSSWEQPGPVERPHVPASEERVASRTPDPTLVAERSGGVGRSQRTSDVPAIGDGPQEDRRRRLRLAAVLGACLVALLLVLLGRQWLSRNDTGSSADRRSSTSATGQTSGRGTRSASTANSSAPATNTGPGTSGAVPTTDTPTTEAPTTDPPIRPSQTDPGPTSSAPTTAATTSSTVVPGQGATQVADTLNRYYSLIGRGEYNTTWAQLTPEYQRRTGGFDAYTRFWKHYDRVDLSNIRIHGDLTGTATLRYHQTDGAVVQESGRFRFVRRPSGDLAIADYRVSSRIG